MNTRETPVERRTLAVSPAAVLLVMVPLIAAIGLAVVTEAGSLRAGVSATVMARDPAAVLDGAWYVGVISTVIIAAWAAALALTVFVAATQRGTRALWAFAALCALVGLDDLLQLHEHDNGPITSLPESGFAGVYGLLLLLTAALLWRSGHRLALLPLVAGGLALGFSAGFDLVAGSRVYALEDMAKLAGALQFIAVPVAVHLGSQLGRHGLASTPDEPAGRPRWALGPSRKVRTPQGEVVGNTHPG